MTHQELIDECNRWPADHMYLTVRRPSGRTIGPRIRLFGRTGPYGRVCSCEEVSQGFVDIVACFDKAKVREAAERLEDA